MILPLAGICLSLVVQAPSFDFNVESQSGLKIVAKGIPFIRGSWFQYYAPNWTKGFYSSRWNSQTVERIDADNVKVSFRGAEGKASGTVSYQRIGNRLVVVYRFDWNSDEPALVEVTPGMVSMSPFVGGEIAINGKTRSLSSELLTGDLFSRSLGKPSELTQLMGTAAKFSVNSSLPLVTFDARGYNQDWAEKEAILWQGVLGIEMKKGVTSSLKLEYDIAANERKSFPSRVITLQPNRIESAVLPDETLPVLIPKPKRADLDWKKTLRLTNLWRFPAGRPKYFDLFKSELDKRFKMPVAGSVDGRVDFDGGMSKLQKLEGGYRISVTPSSISIYGQEEAGLQSGMYRLAQIAFIRNGEVVLPTGVIEDEPRTDFRGVHLFVGPKAMTFQQKLWNNVLRPLGLNKVVLQCERTEWKSLPGVSDSMTMKQEDLVKLVNWYRSQNVEPIPLIQSFGHMEWFFAKGANLDLAYNRDEPYSLDPRKKEAKELIGKVWDEAVSVLKPKTIHFGLDEVDMRGFNPSNPKLVTELWKEQVPFLNSVAIRNNVKMMLWGDKGLAPNEAVDAALGDDSQNALERRQAIMKGAYIGDWHYKSESSHVPFLKSLQVWRNEEFRPIATTWYQPDNIRSFYLAASLENAGTLQTTWAGYESNEESMIQNLNQFTAMVLAADYAWSGREDSVFELPYDARKVFARMYNPIASPLKPEAGMTFGPGQRFTAGGFQFGKLEGIQLAGLASSNFSAPDTVEFKVGESAGGVAIAISTLSQLVEGAKVATLEVVSVDGSVSLTPILYGAHLRAKSDKGLSFFGRSENGVSVIQTRFSAKRIKSVRLLEHDLNAGLKVEGLTIFGTQ